MRKCSHLAGRHLISVSIIVGLIGCGTGNEPSGGSATLKNADSQSIEDPSEDQLPVEPALSDNTANPEPEAAATIWGSLKVRFIYDGEPPKRETPDVSKHPYAAVSDNDGHLIIANLPTGTWDFRFRHVDSVYLDGVSVGGSETDKRGTVALKIEQGDNNLGEIKLGPEAFE